VTQWNKNCICIYYTTLLESKSLKVPLHLQLQKNQCTNFAIFKFLCRLWTYHLLI